MRQVSETIDDMLSMPLHSRKKVDDRTVFRVPGGWIYDHFRSTPLTFDHVSSFFVPEPRNTPEAGAEKPGLRLNLARNE